MNIKWIFEDLLPFTDDNSEWRWTVYLLIGFFAVTMVPLYCLCMVINAPLIGLGWLITKVSK